MADKCPRFSRPIRVSLWGCTTVCHLFFRHLFFRLAPFADSASIPRRPICWAGDMFSSKPWGVESPEHWGTLTSDEGGEPLTTRIPTEPGDYRSYYINLRDAIHGNAALEVTPLQAWRTIRTLEMALESSRTGSTIRCDWSHEP